MQMVKTAEKFEGYMTEREVVKRLTFEAHVGNPIVI